MESPQPKRSSSPFEYFLYVAIILETALAALVYKAIFRDAELARLSAYFAVFYFAFLGWAIAQLNILHRDRRPKPATMLRPSDRHTEDAPSPIASPFQEQASQEQAGRLPIETAREEEQSERTSPVLGLTTAQIAIVLVVFATAVATFSWALRLLR